MQRSEQRILTTHVGSIIRPPELLAATNAARQQQSIDTNESYQALLQQAIDEVVRRQVAVGLDIVNDGEFGKSDWANYLLERVTGFVHDEQRLRPLHWLGADVARFPGFFAKELPHAATGAPTDVCCGPIHYRNTGPVRHNIAQLQHALAATPAVEGFFTVVAPASTAYNGVNEYYPSDREYIFALADALREEYLAAYESGLVLQVDDAVLANMYDHLVRQEPKRYREWAELRIEALVHALRGIPADRIRYHVCFGSWHVPHVADAPLDALVDLILQVPAGAYSIEAANPRHEHEWRVWQKVGLPAGKILIPGVVTHHTTTVEHPRVVADRIIRFASIVGRENVIAGTDCGFAQIERYQRVHPEVMWAKYDALVQGARLATEDLFGKKKE